VNFMGEWGAMDATGGQGTGVGVNYKCRDARGHDQELQGAADAFASKDMCGVAADLLVGDGQTVALPDLPYAPKRTVDVKGQ
jgi:hypothetical protein